MDEDTEPEGPVPDEPDWLAAERTQADEWSAKNDDQWVERQAAEALAEIKPPAQWGTTGPVSTNGHANGAPPAEPEQSKADELRGALLHGADILDVPPPDPLIDGWLNLDSLACLYGRPKGGKSFIALDMALCVASGAWWHRHEVIKGPVLYVVAEGVRGIGPRVAAWAARNRVDVPHDLIWLPRAVSLLNPQWSDGLAEIASELKPRLVIIDTLNRSIPGGEENSSKDMGAVIAACDLIKRATGACVLLIHHSGKDTTQGARGHSSLEGAVDSMLELKNGGDGILRLANPAQKDAAEAVPLRFTLVPAADSVAIAPYTGRIEEEAGVGPVGQAVLDALVAIDLPGGVSSSTWQKACDDVPERSFYRWRKRLLELGEVLNLGTDTSPRYAVRGAEEPEF